MTPAIIPRALSICIPPYTQMLLFRLCFQAGKDQSIRAGTAELSIVIGKPISDHLSIDRNFFTAAARSLYKQFCYGTTVLIDICSAIPNSDFDKWSGQAGESGDCQTRNLMEPMKLSFGR